MTKISDLLEYFGIDDYYQAGDLIVSRCHIHDGDNSSAFNINVNEDSNFYGIWFCNTQHCHRKSGNDIISLIKNLLEKNKGEEVSFREILKFCKEFTKDVEVDEDMVAKRDHVNDLLLSKKEVTRGKFPRWSVRRRLQIPARQYLDRGFSAKILDEFDIGYCPFEGRMYKRVVFPVYDENDEYMIGCVGRATFDGQAKWLNKEGFCTSNYLYNLGKALPHIRSLKTIILVEGQGDVLRLYESGIKNVVGLFGSKLSDAQEFLIQTTGALNVIVATDNDDAGESCRKSINESLKYSFNLVDLRSTKKDFGDMSISEINEVIKPRIGKYI